MLKRNTLTTTINELFRSKGLTQHVKSPTRETLNSSTLIDLVLTNSKFVEECDVVDIGMSDHSLVIIRRTHSRKKASPRSFSTRSFKNFNKEAFLNDLRELDWSGVTSAKSVDSATETFNLNVLNTLNKHAPCVKRRIIAYSPPWVNEELLNSTKEREY